MPQCTSGTTTTFYHITFIKDGDDFRIYQVGGQPTNGGEIIVSLPSNMDRLYFTTADFDVGDDHYQVEAYTEIDCQTAIPWTTSSTTGLHQSPCIERDPVQERTQADYDIQLDLVFKIQGPVDENDPPPSAGEVRPPTTVVIRARLG